ncbi:MAG TPA: hypothetical protein VGE21_08060 [Flavobacteriales bacterium]
MRSTVEPYAVIREADVKWERRVWRTLDGRDPMNAWLVGRKSSCMDLMTVPLTTLREYPDMVLYAPDGKGEDGAFRKAIAGAERTAMLLMNDTAAFEVERFMLKEDWIFDAARGVMEVRIIAFAPMVIVRGSEGEVSGHRPLFWLYYPEWRAILGTRPALFPGDITLSFESLFARRIFRSTVTKVSNLQDRAGNDHGSGLDLLLQSEGLRDQLIHMGFDLWHY